jgi:CubicO group peptidase (beta-lactamase class C family)
MSDLGGELDALASGTGFSGVVQIDQSGRIELARAYGLAHRGFEIANELDTRFGIASGAKASPRSPS